MKKYIIFFTLIIISFTSSLNAQSNFKAGEFLKFRIHYTGLNAGYATINVEDVTLNGKSHYHIIGKGNSSGAVRVFFKVDDNYESYIDKSTMKPTKFVRNIVEGSYKRHQIYYFDHANKKAKVENKKDGSINTETIPFDAQDLLSAFYNLRNQDYKKIKTGDFLNQNIFLGDETLKFRLKVLGRETLKTKFGKISAIKIRPYVQSGRIFKESESVTMWISDDENLVPLKIKAGLMVGSLNADLDDFKNLKSPINFSK
ncbi:DUF3108 domain-containing protein [Chishuiella changwenlii]|jgi:hypothetical protein|uniref:DUF3108 domain-containing protein n=1 Tax=Chishuiella changwenlii TaxID=1434701 RepID=UPI002FD8EA2A